MAAIRLLDVKATDRIATMDVKVPLIFEPNITAPVYFTGNLAAIPKIVFW